MYPLLAECLCCASVFSNIISHSNLERMKMFCAFRLHDCCGTTQLSASLCDGGMCVFVCVRMFVISFFLYFKCVCK